MKKLLKLPLFFALLLTGSLLTGCAASTQAVVSTGPVGPYYDVYYGPVYRPYYRSYYGPRVIVRPASVIVRPRAIIVHPGPLYYQPHAVLYRGGRRW